MSTTILVNPENTLKALQAQMSLEMQAAAEPIIQAAIKDAEKAIRDKYRAMNKQLMETCK